MHLATALRNFALVGLAALLPAQALATTVTYSLLNHPDGNQAPPLYGLRLDDLIDDAPYTFDFEYDDGNEVANVKLDFDGTTIRIHGRAYGGKDTGTGYDAVQQGWIDIDFIYTQNVIMADDNTGAPGNDLYVTAESVLNTGSVSLDGWGGDATFTLFDKFSTTEGDSFGFDNDYDPRDPVSEANPMIVSGRGWLTVNGVPLNGGSRDWLFLAEEDAPVSVDDASWGRIKNEFR